jgi:hypothetical protein
MSMRPRTVRATNDVCFSNSGIIEFKEGLFTDPSAVGTVAATSVNVAVPETAAQIRQCVTDAMLKASGDIAVGKMSMQVADHEIQNTVRESVKDHIDSMNSMRETVRQHVVDRIASVASTNDTIRASVDKHVNVRARDGQGDTVRHPRRHLSPLRRDASAANPKLERRDAYTASSMLDRNRVEMAVRNAINSCAPTSAMSSNGIGPKTLSRADVEKSVREALNTHMPQHVHTSVNTNSIDPYRGRVEMAVRNAVEKHMSTPAKPYTMAKDRGHLMREMLY